MENPSEVLGKYEPIVQGLARKLAPYATVIDQKAHDRDDYVAILRERVWHAHQRFDRCGESGPFIWTSLRNAARDARKVRKLQIVAIDEIEYVQEDRDVEGDYELREVVGKLRARLSSEDMQLLEVHAACQNLREVWRKFGSPDSERVFRKRVHGVIERAKRILAGLSFFGPEMAPASLLAERRSDHGEC